MGSSYVRHLERAINKSFTKVLMPLPLRMVGKPGLRLSELPQVMEIHLHPQGSGVLIIQIGGNDIGSIPERQWEEELNVIVRLAVEKFPDYKLFWSDMFPRTSWRYCHPRAGRKHYLRLQRRARKLFYENGGSVIRHPALTIQLLNPDGVHLSETGNAFLLADLEAAMALCLSESASL